MTHEPISNLNNVLHSFSYYAAKHTLGNKPSDAFGSAPCSLSVGRIFCVCTKCCRMPRLSSFSRLNVLNLICFATLDWYLPKHNSAWKLVLQQNAQRAPLAFRRWSLVHQKVEGGKKCIQNSLKNMVTVSPIIQTKPIIFQKMMEFASSNFTKSRLYFNLTIQLEYTFKEPIFCYKSACILVVLIKEIILLRAFFRGSRRPFWTTENLRCSI